MSDSGNLPSYSAGALVASLSLAIPSEVLSWSAKFLLSMFLAWVAGFMYKAGHWCFDNLIKRKK